MSVGEFYVAGGDDGAAHSFGSEECLELKYMYFFYIRIVDGQIETELKL